MSSLVFREIFTRKVIPYIKAEYFEDSHERIIFALIDTFIGKYNTLPSKEAIAIELSNAPKVDDNQFETCKEILSSLEIDETTTIEWLVDNTEKFCQDRAIYLALIKSINIADGKDEKFDKGMIPDILTDAIGITFDAHIGHDFIDDAEQRYDFYHRDQNKIPFHIDVLNEITKGGLADKTMTILMAGPGVGKSAVMCDFAAKNLIDGKNVLYISLEMSEEMISQRIDENLLDLDLDSLLGLPKEVYLRKIKDIKDKTVGKLIVKEYPTGSAGSANFRALLRDLKLKKGFVPDVIYIDYLNICCSSRMRMNVKASLYEYVKMVGEEIRGLGIEFSVPIVTASQFNREGAMSSEPGMGQVSDSFGTSMTADYIWALVTSEELEKDKQIMFIQLKNRYYGAKPEKFLVGINRAKMQLYNQYESISSDPGKQPFITPEMSKKLDRRAFDEFT